MKRLFTLWEVMKQYDLFSLGHLLSSICSVQGWCRLVPASVEDVGDRSRFIGICEELEAYSKEHLFRNAGASANAVNRRLKQPKIKLSPAVVETEFGNLELQVCRDILDHKFVHLSKRTSEYFENGELFSPNVAQRFPSAVRDITDAGNCIALELSTAAVFHLMRVVECGMRSFAVHLGLLKVVVDRKTRKEIPLEYSDWERILNQLPEKVEQKVESLARGQAKQKAQEFYYPALKEISGFKEAWRNHVMHARAEYNTQDAIAVLSHVNRFMKDLAEYGIHEARKNKRK
jgi:hypothetical protein